MTAYSHLDPDFGSVIGIQAINEPIMDASKTPGFGECERRDLNTSRSFCLQARCICPVQKNFVRVIRAVETMLGIDTVDSTAPQGLLEKLLPNTLNVTESILGGNLYGGAVGKVLSDAAPMIAEIAFSYGFDSILGGDCPNRTPLHTV